MLLSGAWGKVIHEKNLMQKISWHCPFNTLKSIYSLKYFVGRNVGNPFQKIW